MKYKSTKTYKNLGSTCFRQWRAKSHCRYLHGYSLSFTFVFASEQLDKNNWVVDFGGLGELKDALSYWFDHTLVVAFDDPNYLQLIKLADDENVCQLRALHKVGCEAFAEFGYTLAKGIVKNKFPHAIVVSCEVSEHEGNSAIYYAPEEK